MSEFGEQADFPDLSMSSPLDQFNATINHMADTYSDELAYGIYGSCFNEDTTGQEEADVRFKRGLLFRFMGEIEQRRGDYIDALGSFQQARAEIVDFNELYSMQLHGLEGHLHMHELDDPEGSIEPYEQAIRIYEENYTGPGSNIPEDHLFQGYAGIMSHLAGAYSRTGEFEKVRELNSKLAVFGRLTPAIYGFDSCEADSSDHMPPTIDQKPIYKEIAEKLGAPESDRTESAEERLEGLRSLERLVNHEAFMPEAPEEKEFVLGMIYGTYAELLPNPNEKELYQTRAVKIANRHGLHIPRISHYIALGNTAALRGRPMKEQHKPVRKSAAAVEAALEAGASLEAARIPMVTQLLFGQLHVMGDYIGIEKAKRRFAEHGVGLDIAMPGQGRPNFN